MANFGLIWGFLAKRGTVPIGGNGTQSPKNYTIGTGVSGGPSRFQGIGWILGIVGDVEMKDPGEMSCSPHSICCYHGKMSYHSKIDIFYGDRHPQRMDMGDAIITLWYPWVGGIQWG